MTYATHDSYFATMPPETRALLVAIQAEVERRVPDAQRCIAYAMPAFRQRKIFFYFAGFGKHIGVYPPVHDPALVAELAPWRGPKGNLIFPLTQDMPIELIGRTAAALARQYAQ